MPVTASVTAIILVTGLGLSGGPLTEPQQSAPATRTHDSGITYRATRRERHTGTHAEIILTCSGPDIRFTLSGLPLSDERHQDIQLTIGRWSRPLYRAELSQDWGQSVTSAALLSAIRSNRPLTVRIEGHNHRLRPVAHNRHNDFTQLCASAVRAATQNPLPQRVILDPGVDDAPTALDLALDTVRGHR